MATLEQYYNLLEEHIEFYQNLVAFQQQKLDVLLDRQVLQLDQLVKEEQVYVLQARGLEQRRLELHNQLGFGEMTFAELIDYLDDPMEKQRFRELKTNLGALIEVLQQVNHSCQEVVDTQLQQVEKSLKKVQQVVKKSQVGILNRSC